jgi:hypothetical protein
MKKFFMDHYYSVCAEQSSSFRLITSSFNMGVLVESPAKVQDYFLPVPDIGDALISLESNSASKLLKDLGKVFVKYNTFDRFSISLVHRHFDLNEDEILVEAFAEDETTSVSLPWHLMGKYYKDLGHSFVLAVK